MALITAHRPPHLKGLAGNKVLKSTLESKLKLTVDKRPKVYLLIGEKGSGKTTVARIIANTLKVADREFVELDATDESGGVAAIRELKRTIRYPPITGDNRAWFIDEAHNITAKGQEAFLKMLEEPPAYAHFIFATTDPQKLIKTFKDRCLVLELKPLTKAEMEEWLDGIIQAEDAVIPDKVFDKIVRDAEGLPRVALSLLEKVIDLEEGEMMEAVQKTEAAEVVAFDIAQALMKKGSTWAEVAPLIKSISDYENARYVMLGYCESILLKGGKDKDPMVAKAALVMTYMEKAFYDSKRAGFTLACYQIFMG